MDEKRRALALTTKGVDDESFWRVLEWVKKSESENKIYWSFLVSMRGWIDGWINEEDERKKENLEEVRRNASHIKKKCLRFFTFTHFHSPFLVYSYILFVS